MTSVVELELDTTAPQITWGAPAGATAGQTLSVSYALNEPDLLSAELVLPDARTIAGNVFPDRLEVALPADTPSGLGTLTAHVRDEVFNAAARTLAVALAGVTPPTAPGPLFQIGRAPGGAVG